MFYVYAEALVSLHPLWLLLSIVDFSLHVLNLFCSVPTLGPLCITGKKNTILEKAVAGMQVQNTILINT